MENSQIKNLSRVAKSMLTALPVVLLVAIAWFFLPINLVRCGPQNAVAGNHLRNLVMNVLVMNNDDNAWPQSTQEYRLKCQQAKIDDYLVLDKKYRVFVVWENFRRSETEKKILPVCVVIEGTRAAVGFADGHYQYVSGPQIEKILQFGLAGL